MSKAGHSINRVVDGPLCTLVTLIAADFSPSSDFELNSLFSVVVFF